DDICARRTPAGGRCGLGNNRHFREIWRESIASRGEHRYGRKSDRTFGLNCGASMYAQSAVIDGAYRQASYDETQGWNTWRNRNRGTTDDPVAGAASLV